MQFVRDLPTVAILKATAVEPPPGSSILIESNKGPLAFVAPREGFSDTVVTFALMDGDNFNTNWYRNISFPLFLFNSLQVLGNARESAGDEVHLPGQPVILRAETPTDTIKVTAPDGKTPRRSRGRRKGRSWTTDTDADRPLPRPLGARRPAPLRGQPVRRPRERPRPPRPRPRGRPRRRRPTPTRSRSATTPSPARGTRAWSARMVVAAGRRGAGRRAASSGISTTNVSTSEPEMEAGEARPRGSDPQ